MSGIDTTTSMQTTLPPQAVYSSAQIPFLARCILPLALMMMVKQRYTSTLVKPSLKTSAGKTKNEIPLSKTAVPESPKLILHYPVTPLAQQHQPPAPFHF